LAAPNDLLACLVVVALCVAVGLPTIRPDNYFLGDDFGLVHHLHDLPLARFLSYFYTDWTEGTFSRRECHATSINLRSRLSVPEGCRYPTAIPAEPDLPS
jgi:hypothetical protein